MSLVVVGTVAFDAIETPFGKTDKIIGGAATYIGLAASNFSNKIQLVSTVGDDFPTPYIESLNKRGIRTDGLQVHKGQKSFFWYWSLPQRHEFSRHTRNRVECAGRF